MITSIIDWAGTTGTVGRVYLLLCDDEWLRPPSHDANSVVIDTPQGRVAVPYAFSKWIKTNEKIPPAICLHLARKQWENGHITGDQFKEAERKIKRALKGAN